MFILAVLFIFSINFAFSGSHNSDKITFIVLGHVYTDYDALNLSVSLINDEDPEFVIFTGDSLNNYDESWEELSKIVEMIRAPVFFVPGNHDIANSNPDSGFFVEEMSSELYYHFTIDDKTFIILNSVDGPLEYDISLEQVDFVKEIYEKDDTQKFIFMHHCLFFNYDNLFCNSRPYIDENNWNKLLVPLIREETSAVFTGDLGYHEPYFGYEEDGISYFGVGFSSKELQVYLPQHFLKVTVEGTELIVEPVPIRQDLTKVKYFQRLDKDFSSLLKSRIKKNLPLILKSLAFIILILFLTALLFLILLLKSQSKKKDNNKN